MPVDPRGRVADQFGGLADQGCGVGKAEPVSESTSVLLRIEAFNDFNHTQFYSPSSVNGGVTDSPGFGQVVSAAAPRLVQLAMKFNFAEAAESG